MSDRQTEEHAYRDYVTALERALDLPAAQQAERDAVERSAREVLDTAMQAERDAKDRISSAKKSLAEAGGRVSRLVVASGATADEADSSSLPERLVDFDQAIRALLADVRAAESAWSWVERARVQSAAAARPAGPAPDPGGSDPTHRQATPAPAPEQARGGGCALLIFAIFANLALVAGLVGIFSS